MVPLVVALALAAPPPALDPQRLPHLPLRGLVRQTGGAVEFQSLRGRAFGQLAGFQLAQPGIPHGVLLMRGRARYTVDLLERRVRPARKSTIEIPGGCRLAARTAPAPPLSPGRMPARRRVRERRALPLRAHAQDSFATRRTRARRTRGPRRPLGVGRVLP